MSLILIASIAIRLLAFGWAVVLVWRLRDWRMAFLTLMVGLMAIRQTLTLFAGRESWTVSPTAEATELPGLVVSVMALLAILFIERFLIEHKRATDALNEANTALQESEKYQRTLFDASPYCIHTMDTAGRFLSMNRAGLTMVHAEREADVVGTSFQRIVGKKDLPRVLNWWKQALAGQSSEFEFATSDGREMLSYFVPLIRDGEVERVMGLTQEITGRKLAENELNKALQEITDLKNQLQTENIYLREALEREEHSEYIVGESETLKATLRQIELVAPTDSTVLILGESGTGKELVAREIHRRSTRSDRPLIKVNCASVPRELYESEFFGHVRGAFTGAVRDRAGRFELANGGTLFLDEVGEIPLEMQGKLLRVLQEGQYERVGGESTFTANVRIIAATNRDLKSEVEKRRFREDLYYRLNVFPIIVAPLRDRKQDVPLLVAHFATQACAEMKRPVPRVSRASMLALERYHWPGNIRELQNVVERAVIVARGNGLSFDVPGIPAAATIASENQPASARPLAAFVPDAELRKRERDNLVAALEHAGWRVFGKNGAAALLGIKPTTLSSRMKKYRLRRPS